MSNLPVPRRIASTFSFGSSPRATRASATVSIGSRSSLTTESRCSISRVLARRPVMRIEAKRRARQRSGSARTSLRGMRGNAARIRAGSAQAPAMPCRTLAKAIRTSARQISTSSSRSFAPMGEKRR
jgi:hypothetical protein